MIKQLVSLMTVIILASSCNQRSPENLDLDLDNLGVGELKTSDETVNEIIQNIASPIEVVSLIYSLDIPFSTSYLAYPKNLTTGMTSFEMAYSIGVLSADLGYMNLYEEPEAAIDHLDAIRRLSDALQIGQFFDLNALRQISTSRSGLDSLLFISVNNFNNMEEYLREDGRSNLSAMLVAGVWMEGLYLTTQVAKKVDNEELRTMIGEQKLILNDLLLVLYNYREEEVIARYINDFEYIKNIYDDVKITYEVGDPQTIEKDGMLMVVQSEFSQVTMSGELLGKIIEVTEQIRNAQVNLPT